MFLLLKGESNTRKRDQHIPDSVYLYLPIGSIYQGKVSSKFLRVSENTTVG
jgi:hypothetical protein